MVVRAATSQFDSGKIEIRRIPNVGDTETIDRVVEQALETRAMIAFTLVLPELKEYLLQKAASAGVITVDVLSPII